jgi:hypothetical protein
LLKSPLGGAALSDIVVPGLVDMLLSPRLMVRHAGRMPDAAVEDFAGCLIYS